MPTPKLFVAFTSDTEDNHPNYVPGWNKCASDYDKITATLNWSWSRYWRDLSDCFRSRNVPVTWFIRVDDGPIRDSMLDLFRNEILELKSIGDEVGIHIHTFSWDPELSEWVQTKDPNLESKIVRLSVDMFENRLGYVPLSVRMGWLAMSDEIMRALDERGLLVDSSAIPGMSSSGMYGKRDNIYDWVRAPRAPYHPSYDDYQSPGNMRILEMPISTQDASRSNNFTRLVNRFSGMKNLVKLLPLTRRLNLNLNPWFKISPWWSSAGNSRIIKEYCEKTNRDGIAFLVGSFHACDILDPMTGKKNPIFERYITRIIEEISSLSGIDVIFTTLSEMAKNYAS